MIVITTPTGAIGHQVLDAPPRPRRADPGDRARPLPPPGRAPASASRWCRDRTATSTSSSGRSPAPTPCSGWCRRTRTPRASRPPTSTSPGPPARRFERTASGGWSASRPSAAGVRRRTPGCVTASLAMDDLIASTGVSFRALTMPSFMDNILRQVDAIASQGVFFSPISGRPQAPDRAPPATSPPSPRDCCSTAPGADRTASPVLGPEDLSDNDMAQGMLGMMAAKDNGLDNAEPRTPQSSSPTSFRQWCEEVLAPAVLAVSAAAVA